MKEGGKEVGYMCLWRHIKTIGPFYLVPTSIWCLLLSGAYCLLGGSVMCRSLLSGAYAWRVYDG